MAGDSLGLWLGMCAWRGKIFRLDHDADVSTSSSQGGQGSDFDRIALSKRALKLVVAFKGDYNFEIRLWLKNQVWVTS